MKQLFHRVTVVMSARYTLPCWRVKRIQSKINTENMRKLLITQRGPVTGVEPALSFHASFSD